MQTTTSTQNLEAIALQRLSEENFIDSDVVFDYSRGLFTGFLQITSTISIDFTDSQFCLADEGEKIADVSKELEKAYEIYLDANYRYVDASEADYEFADMKNKFQREN